MNKKIKQVDKRRMKRKVKFMKKKGSNFVQFPFKQGSEVFIIETFTKNDFIDLSWKKVTYAFIDSCYYISPGVNKGHVVGYMNGTLGVTSQLFNNKQTAESFIAENNFLHIPHNTKYSTLTFEEMHVDKWYLYDFKKENPASDLPIHFVGLYSNLDGLCISFFEIINGTFECINDSHIVVYKSDSLSSTGNEEMLNSDTNIMGFLTKIIFPSLLVEYDNIISTYLDFLSLDEDSHGISSLFKQCITPYDFIN